MSRVITDLHPSLQAKVEELRVLCKKKGLQLLITSCVRDKKEQEDCVRRGTSSVHYPNSHHNWGTAFDFCKNVKGHEYDDGEFFKEVGRLAEDIGLEWGGNWKKPDRPHIQLKEWGSTTAKLVSKYGTPDNFRKTWNKPWLPVIEKGDKVRVLEYKKGKGMTYTGKLFNVYYKDYDVIQVKGDRVVIGKGTTVTCAINIMSLVKI